MLYIKFLKMVVFRNGLWFLRLCFLNKIKLLLELIVIRCKFFYFNNRFCFFSDGRNNVIFIKYVRNNKDKLYF